MPLIWNPRTLRRHLPVLSRRHRYPWGGLSRRPWVVLVPVLRPLLLPSLRPLVLPQHDAERMCTPAVRMWWWASSRKCVRFMGGRYHRAQRTAVGRACAGVASCAACAGQGSRPGADGFVACSGCGGTGKIATRGACCAASGDHHDHGDARAFGEKACDERVTLDVWQLDAVSPLDAAPHVAAHHDAGVYELWELRFDADSAAQ